MADALGVAREGLSLMHSSHVIRTHPGEAATLGMLTMMVERLASELGEPGADERDLREVLEVLEVFAAGQSNIAAQVRADWLPFLKSRLDLRHGPP